MEQGTFERLNVSGGYVSSLDLPLPDWDFAPERLIDEAPPRFTESPNSNRTGDSEADIQAEANRRTGDRAIYLYYIKSVGWIPTLIFMVSIVIFIFGMSFPSKSVNSMSPYSY